MPCTNCSCDFGILKKEIACEKCGFGFCPKCCKKQEVPESSTTVKKYLCSNCLIALTGNKPVSNISPPLAHKKRMLQMKKKSYSVDESASTSFSHEIDRELFERLKRLKKDEATEPCERDIEVRLAKLKGMDPSKYKAPPIEVYRPPDKRTSIEKVSDLLMQVTEEVRLDSKKVKPEDDIAARLAALRNEAVKQSNIPEESVPEVKPDNVENISVEDTLSKFQDQSQELSTEACKGIKELNINPEYKELISSMKHEKETRDSGEEDEEEAEQLVAQLLASNISQDLDELESNNEQNSEKSASSKKGSLDEEFPWCVICTNNAQIRCFDCDQDLYCLRCFRECHDSFEIRDHKTCPYTPPTIPAL